jgi:two-component system, NtrC family, sensor kinase
MTNMHSYTCVNMTHVLFRNLSLKWVFLCIAIIPLGFISAVTIYLSFKIMETGLEKQMEQQIELVARTLHEPILLSLEKNEKEHFEMILSSTEEIRRIYTINLFDKHGDLIWSNDQKNESVDPIITENVLSTASSENTYNEAKEGSIYSHFEPIIAKNGHVMGLVHLTRKKSNIKNEISKIKNKIILIYAIALTAIATIVIYLYKGFVLSPIRQLANQLHSFNLADSSNQQLMTLDGPDELKIIKEAFNSLYKKLSLYKTQVIDEQDKKTRLQDKLKQSEKLAAIGTLAGGVAHDLGNPLSSIDATVQRMERLYPDDDGQVRYLKYIRNETKRMENIIHQLLNYSEQKTCSREQTDLKKIISDLIKSFKEVHPEIHFESTWQGTECTIPLDKLKMEQLISNLIKNSIEAITGTSPKDAIVQTGIPQESRTVFSGGLII